MFKRGDFIKHKRWGSVYEVIRKDEDFYFIESDNFDDIEVFRHAYVEEWFDHA